MEKMIFKPRNAKIKMDSEEIQDYLKLKAGNGSHRDKTKYNRKVKHKNID